MLAQVRPLGPKREPVSGVDGRASLLDSCLQQVGEASGSQFSVILPAPIVAIRDSWDWAKPCRITGFGSAKMGRNIQGLRDTVAMECVAAWQNGTGSAVRADGWRQARHQPLISMRPVVTDHGLPDSFDIIYAQVRTQCRESIALWSVISAEYLPTIGGG